MGWEWCLWNSFYTVTFLFSLSSCVHTKFGWNISVRCRVLSEFTYKHSHNHFYIYRLDHKRTLCQTMNERIYSFYNGKHKFYSSDTQTSVCNWIARYTAVKYFIITIILSRKMYLFNKSKVCQHNLGLLYLNIFVVTCSIYDRRASLFSSQNVDSLLALGNL